MHDLTISYDHMIDYSPSWTDEVTQVSKVIIQNVKSCSYTDTEVVLVKNEGTISLPNDYMTFEKVPVSDRQR